MNKPQGIRLASALILLAATGCGNQMYRQPSFNPLDTPRAAPPPDAVPVTVALTPTDGRPVVSPAYGDYTASPVVRNTTSFPSKEPDLPPPNLSDQARYQPAPASVNALKDPLPGDPRVVQAGHILFVNRCVQCHNAGGYGYGTVGQYLVPHPPDLAGPLVQNISDGAMFWHITMGQGKMPGFRHWTTPSERWSLVQYVRSLKGAAPGQKSDSTQVVEGSPVPYPVYGVTGYENGKSAYPFKVLNPYGGDADSQKNVQSQGFGQTPLSNHGERPYRPR